MSFFFFYQQNQLQDYADERYQLNLLKQNLCTSLVWSITKLAVSFWTACIPTTEKVILLKVIERLRHLHLRIEEKASHHNRCIIFWKLLKNAWNLSYDLLCTSRRGTNCTISRTATRPVVDSSLSPLSASSICEK